MNKKVLVTAGIAALAVSASVAKADEVTTNGQVSTTASVSSTATQAIPTQSQVETAREQANAASQAVSHQESVIANHEETINQAKASLATADANLQKAQTATDEASLEAIAVAQGQVTSAEHAANEAKSAVATAQSAEKTAKYVADKQQAVVNADQANVNAKATEVADAQKSVDAAKAALNGSSASEVASNQSKAQSDFDVATAAEKKAQEELEAAQAAYKEKATAISSKEEQLTADQNAANQAKAAYETAQTVANEKAVALAAVEAAKKKAEASTTNIRQKFTVSSEYISALKIYESRTSTAEEKYQAEQTLKDVNKRDRENNKYQDNEADKNITISDLNKLSEAQITDLSLYTSSLINQIRSAFGTTETSVSKGSVMATDRVTDGYVADNWGWESISNRRHDSAALACAGKSFNTVNIGENLNTWQGLTGPFTLNEIKEYIYEAMLDFMFNGQEWNHARSIAGLTSDGGETYIGTDLSVVAGAFNVHVNNINENSISFDSSFDTTKIANPYVGSQSQPSLNANLAATQVAYETAKQANDQAQSDLANKKVASESATLKLKKTQSELTALKATASKLAAAQTNLSEKQAALKQAKQALAFAKNRVAALTNASANLAKAKAERAMAFAKLTAAKGALSTERAKLVELSAKSDKLTSEYTTVQTAFDNYMKAKADKERQTQLSKEFAKITSKGLTPVSIYDVDGKVVALTTQEQAAQIVAQVPVNYGQTKAEKQAPVQEADSLPETGESTASGFSLVGLFMTLLAFLGFVDRRTRRN
ncbi:MAG: SEC10/PgrA surface exclusion domain-containing protein [Streptococcus vestibularis]|nr:SEC10/PgrA surface exclusion domain-containing protein [Streptococcus vestibularis]